MTQMTMTKEYILTEYFALAERLGVSPEVLCGIIVLAVFVVLFLLRRIAFFGFLMRWLQRIIVVGGLCALLLPSPSNPLTVLLLSFDAR